MAENYIKINNKNHKDMFSILSFVIRVSVAVGNKKMQYIQILG